MQNQCSVEPATLEAQTREAGTEDTVPLTVRNLLLPIRYCRVLIYGVTLVLGGRQLLSGIVKQRKQK